MGFGVVMKKITSRLGWAVLAGCMSCFSPNLPADETQSCSLNSAKTLNQAAKPYSEAIQKAATRYEISPALIKAVIAGSSCFDPLKLSPQGAIGLMQLTPLTARRFGAANVFDPEANIDAGSRYLSYLSKRYEGSLAPILTAYAADEGWEWQHETILTPFPQVQDPVTRMLDTLLKLENNKKANRVAQALLRQWKGSAESYQAALVALPIPPVQQANARWFKSRLTRVHYQRTPEERSCAGLGSKALAAKAAAYEPIIQKAAKRHGVNPALVKSVIATESCYREMVVSYKGASGLMQLMPETAAELGVFDIFDPEENINAGTRYLGWLLRHYNGSVTHAIAAYNAGPGRITQGEPVTIAFTETRGYIGKVLGGLTRLESGKKAIENAQLLLADWEQAELAYQAALQGETLAVAPVTDTDVVEGVPVSQEGSVPLADEGVAGMAIPEAKLAYLRSDKALAVSSQFADEQPKVQLISAFDQGIVRVKRISAVSIEPSSAEPLAETLPVDAVAPAAIDEQQPVTVGLADCEALPAFLRDQTQLQGNGRYGALFYPVQADETLEVIAGKLGMNVQDIVWLSNMQPDAVPRAGSLLKVAECSRTL